MSSVEHLAFSSSSKDSIQPTITALRMIRSLLLVREPIASPNVDEPFIVPVLPRSHARRVEPFGLLPSSLLLCVQTGTSPSFLSSCPFGPRLPPQVHPTPACQCSISIFLPRSFELRYPCFPLASLAAEKYFLSALAAGESIQKCVDIFLYCFLIGSHWR